MNIDIIDERSRSEWLGLINEWVHSELDRSMLIRRLLDGLTYGELAAEFGLSEDCVKKRIKKAQAQLFKHI